MAKIFKYKKEIVHLSSKEDLEQTRHLEGVDINLESGASVTPHSATGAKVSPRHLEAGASVSTSGAIASPRLLEAGTSVTPYPATGARVSSRHLEAGIGWVDLQPDGGLCKTEIEDFNQISQGKSSRSSKKILEKELNLENNKSRSGSMEPEVTKKKRRRFRPRNRRRGDKGQLERECPTGGTDHHSRRRGEEAHFESEFRIGRTDNIERRGKKRKLDRLTEEGDDLGRRRDGGNNDIDVRPKLSPKALDRRQVEKYVLEDPALNNKRRRIDRNSRNCGVKRGVGILGRPPLGSGISGSPTRGSGISGSPPSRGNGILGSPPAARNKLLAAPGIVYSPTELRKLQTEKTAVAWPSFLSPGCKNRRGFWDPFIFHARTAEEVRKNGSGAAAVNVTVRRNLTRHIGEANKGLEEVRMNGSGAAAVNVTVRRNLIRDIGEDKKGLENSDMKNGTTNNLTLSSDISRVSSTELFKKDIKDIVRKTLSAHPIPKEVVELGKLFESEMENIDSPDNFSDNESGEDLINLPEPVPALKKNPNHIKISAFTDLPQPVPAQKMNSDINKKSTIEIIKAMKTVKCQVKINPNSEIRDAIADEVRILQKKKEEDIKFEEIGESTNVNISVPADNTIVGSAVNEITESVDNISEAADDTIAKPIDGKIDKLAVNKISEPTDYNIAETDDSMITKSAHDSIAKPVDNSIAKTDDSKITKSAHEFISKPVDNNLAKSDDDTIVKSAYNNLGEPADSNIAELADGKFGKYSDKNIALIDDCSTEIKIEKLDPLEAMYNIVDQSKDINREVIDNENNQIHPEIEQDLGEEVTVDEMGRKEAALFLAWLPKETVKNEVIDDGKVNEETGDETVESEEFALKCDFGDFDVKYCFICEEYDHFMREECLFCKNCGEKLTAASARGHYIKECCKNTVANGVGGHFIKECN